MVWIEPHPRRLPSPQEIAQGRAIIRDADLKIAALSAQIENLERLRSNLQTVRDNQASFIATFRRLPPELLEEIAQCYIKKLEPHGTGGLEQVCSSLRAVVLGMKWIWQTIRIVHLDQLDRYIGDILCTSPKNLELALMRAAPSPVTLVVDSGLNRYCFKSLETLSHVETLVLDNIHDDDQGRWVVPDSLRHNPYFPRMELPGLKVINVVGEYLPAKYILTCLNALYNSKLPSISLGMRSYETIDLVALVSLPIFRSIHSITIATALAPKALLPDNDYMPQLETLTLRKDTTLLQCRMPNLQSLSIYLPLGTFSIALVPETVEILEIEVPELRGGSKASPSLSLANLTRFTIRRTRLIDELWPRLDLPNLERLVVWSAKVTLGTQESDRPIIGDKGIFGLLPSLTYLALGYLSQHLIEDFSTIPHLRLLQIENCPFAKGTISCLVDDSAILPDLKNLSVDGPACQSIDRFEWRCASVRPNLEIRIVEID